MIKYNDDDDDDDLENREEEDLPASKTLLTHPYNGSKTT